VLEERCAAGQQRKYKECQYTRAKRRKGHGEGSEGKLQFTISTDARMTASLSPYCGLA
jgi:hypothetical protein